MIGADDLGQVQEVAGLQQVLRQPRPDPPPHAPDATSRPRWSVSRASRESYYFPPQLNCDRQQLPLHLLRPGAGHDEGRHPPLPRALERGRQRHPQLLARRIACKPGTGWLVPPCVLHAPGSLVTYEPQWGSDVFGMYQSMVEGRRVPWELLVKDVPAGQAPGPRLPRRAARLGGATSIPTSRTTTTSSRSSVAGARRRRLRRQVDRLRQGRRRGALHRQGADRRARADGHDQGRRRLRPDRRAGPRHDRQARRRLPGDIRFGELTEDEVFVTDEAGQGGRDVREHRHRAPRHPALLRPRRPSQCAQRWRCPKELTHRSVEPRPIDPSMSMAT